MTSRAILFFVSLIVGLEGMVPKQRSVPSLSSSASYYNKKAMKEALVSRVQYELFCEREWRRTSQVLGREVSYLLTRDLLTARSGMFEKAIKEKK